MADVDAIVLVAGEVRGVQQRQDYIDKETGEVSKRDGRILDVLTFGGFLKVTVPGAHDAWVVEEGDVILVQARVLPWSIPARGDHRARFGTAFHFAGEVTGDQLAKLADELQPRLKAV